MSSFRLLTGVCFAASLVACASTGVPKPKGSSPDQITAPEIVASGATNAYEAITRLRPNWLRQTGTASINQGQIRSQSVVIYLDGQRFGDLQSLRTLSITDLKSMQWLDAARAATLLSGLGSESISGAIVIKTR